MPEDDFASAVAGYDFKLGNGHLEVNTFAAMIRSCMGMDGIHMPPASHDIIALLEDIACDRLPAETPCFGRFQVEEVRRDEDVYPAGYCMVIHVAALSRIREFWVWNIGLQTPGHATDQGMGYMAWIRPEWAHTRTFIQRFHKQCVDIERSADKKAAKELGYSALECLHLSLRDGIDLDAAELRLRVRNAGFRGALARMDLAIVSGFPLEAIAIEESLISSCLHSILIVEGVKRPPSAFSQLLSRFRSAGGHSESFPSGLLDEIDAWRLARNSATHRFVARDLCDPDEGPKDFLEEATETAIVGKGLSMRMTQWFHEESFHFLRTDFDLPTQTLN